jgi:hypothetical protein
VPSGNPIRLVGRHESVNAFRQWAIVRKLVWCAFAGLFRSLGCFLDSAARLEMRPVSPRRHWLPRPSPRCVITNRRAISPHQTGVRSGDNRPENHLWSTAPSLRPKFSGSNGYRIRRTPIHFHPGSAFSAFPQLHFPVAFAGNRYGPRHEMVALATMSMPQKATSATL